MGASEVGHDGTPQWGEPSEVEAGVLDPEAIVVDLRTGDTSVALDPAPYAGNGSAMPDLPVPEPPTHSSGVPAHAVGLTEIGPRLGLLGATSLQRGLKRAIDVSVAMIALLLLIPVVAIVALVIKASSQGPVLYRSRRVGRGGEVFEFWKFRTMDIAAEQDRWTVDHLNEASGPVFKITDDPRVTPVVGRFLRRFSLDEVPQLVHVVSGRMSLVGPRPPLPDEVSTYDNRARQRLAVKPGLTCTWQTSGRSDIEFSDWVEMDVEYIETWSLRQDIKLIMRTIPAVLGGRGAY